MIPVQRSILIAVALASVGAGARASPASDLPVAVPAAACLVDGQVEDLALRDGVVYLAGRFTHARPPGESPGGPAEVARRWAAACDAATGEVLAWDPGLDCLEASGCSNPHLKSVALSPDGAWVYLGGRFRSVAGTSARNAVRVGAVGRAEEGALDPAWRPEPNDRVQRILPAPSGARVYLAGTFTELGEPEIGQATVAAVDASSGAVISAFDPAITLDAGSTFRTAYALALSPDESTLWFGGQFDRVEGEPRSSAAAVGTTGGDLLPFAPALADANPNDGFVQIHDIRLDGAWVYLCGDWWATEGIGQKENQRNVNRFDPQDGTVDPGFWVGTDGGVQGCDLDPNLGVLFVGGHFDCVVKYVDGVEVPGGEACGGDGLVGFRQRDLFAIRLSDGSIVDWNPDTGGGPGSWAITRAEGRLLAGGTLFWPRVGAASHQNLLAFDLPLFADGFERGDKERWSGPDAEPQ